MQPLNVWLCGLGLWLRCLRLLGSLFTTVACRLEGTSCGGLGGSGRAALEVFWRDSVEVASEHEVHEIGSML